MKKIILISFAILLLSLSAFAESRDSWKADLDNQADYQNISILASTLTLDEFLELTPKLYREYTGERLGIKNTVKLKAAQHMVKKSMVDQDEKNSKSQVVALILVALVGGLGIHRFYLGYTTIGIIQLLTLGGCGIWALIDLIRIITGDLGPADGSAYDPTL
jgi:TM2 domain-containing membrane protein YozV